MSEEKPKAEYVRFEGEADFQKAVDLLLEQAGRELRIFDPDLASLHDSPRFWKLLDSLPSHGSE